MAEQAIIWAIICITLAVVLFFMEVFIPSGGVLGFLAGVAHLAGLFLLFRVDTVVGLIGILVSLIAIPFLLGFAIKIWPHTPIGRLLILGSPEPEQQKDAESATDSQAVIAAGNTTTTATESLVGLTGKAVTDMRPVGTCIIDGQRQQCLAERGTISAGTAVKVVSADGMHIKVRPI